MVCEKIKLCWAVQLTLFMTFTNTLISLIMPWVLLRYVELIMLVDNLLKNEQIIVERLEKYSTALLLNLTNILLRKTNAFISHL